MAALAIWQKERIVMNTIYYLITRKIIRGSCIGLVKIFESIFYMSLVTILLTILTIVFREHLINSDATDLSGKGIGVLLGLIAFGSLFAIRLAKQINTYDLREEPLFVQNFIKDCSRSDNDLEKKMQQKKEAKIQKKKEIAQQKKEVIRKKKELTERIDHRSDILDL
jgi:hypothetical protein